MMEKLIKGDTIDGENKIVLFHGPVNKVQTDIDHTVSSNSFQVDMFDGYDMTMLGDIHKRQTFGEGYEWSLMYWFYDSTKSW